MEIGFVGLGKMGANMVARIRRDSDHDVVAFDFDAGAVARAAKTGAPGAASLREDHGVPTPALSAALNSRFYSRAQGDYSARVLAALRNQFGGHAVKKSGS